MKNKLSRLNKKHIFLLIIAIAIAGMLILQFVFNKPVVQEVTTPITGFTQLLIEDTDWDNNDIDDWNEIVFPASAIACCPSNAVEDVFESILDEGGPEIWIACNDTTCLYGEDCDWTFWYNQKPHNNLDVIYPYITYHVHVDTECTLTINCWD